MNPNTTSTRSNLPHKTSTRKKERKKMTKLFLPALVAALTIQTATAGAKSEEYGKYKKSKEHDYYYPEYERIFTYCGSVCPKQQHYLLSSRERERLLLLPKYFHLKDTDFPRDVFRQKYAYDKYPGDYHQYYERKPYKGPYEVGLDPVLSPELQPTRH
ncbi:hypothetical protein BC938DRAFT_471722 [Jimgerdemannia flammicorona]|uniref:Uncharacterized protein n=1 Tax=Jimgerdemannia flammicorona TaxID=994334 RepID=A0A433Q7J8_9FUNG|nr:hypothetical protein BC938DRAFT_471722 [Jimgerdemannia flammicorona]